MKNQEQNTKNKGFTMIELMVTIAVLSFGIVGVYGAFYSFVKLTSNISYRFTSAYLAQEGLEIVRNIRDNNVIAHAPWSTGLMGCSTGCQGDYKTGTSLQASQNQLLPYSDSNFLKLNADGFYSYDQGTPTIFKRKIIITQPSGTDILKVNVQVFWDYSGKSYNISGEEYLYNWY